MQADLPALLPLICPRCGHVSERGRELWTVSIESAPVTQPTPDGGPEEILEGVLRCDNTRCRAAYPIVDGVPILVADPAQLLVNQPMALQMPMHPTTLATCVQGATDDAPLSRVLEHLSIYLDAHWGDRAQPAAAPPATPWGGGALYSAVAEIFPPTSSPAAGCAVELGCSVGRGLSVLRQSSALTVGIDLHLPALRAARRLLRGDALPFSRRMLGRHYQPAEIAADPRAAEAADPPRGRVVLLCADVLDPPLAPAIADRVLALNVLDSVSLPAQLVSVADGLCAPDGALLLSSPYTWQSSVVREGHRIDAEQGQPERALRTQFQTGAGLSAAYRLDWEAQLPWDLRRDARSVQRYWIDTMLLRKGAPA